MRNGLSTRFFKLSKLETLFSPRPKTWRLLSLLLTIGGVTLLGVGGWMLYDQYRDILEPPPARILEVSIADLATETPAAGATSAPLTTKGEVTFVPVTPTLTAAVTTPATPVSRSTASAESTPKQPAATPTRGEAGLSLADNPLPMVEAAERPNPTPGDKPDQAEKAKPAAPPAEAVTRIVAESIELDADVVQVGWQAIVQDGVAMNAWSVAYQAAGWHNNSALPGQGGNVVLSGHHNIDGEVFRYIVDLEPGAVITLYDGDRAYDYLVEDKFIVKDKDEPEAIRRENAKWIGPFNEERLTLVTCWPYTNNTHRVIVIAKPAPPS